VDEGLPRGVLVDPLVDRGVVGLVELPERGHRHDGLALGPEIRARDEGGGHPVPYLAVDLAQVLDGYLKLVLEDLFDKVWATDVAHVPLLDPPYTFRAPHVKPGDQRYVPETSSAEVSQDRLPRIVEL